MEPSSSPLHASFLESSRLRPSPRLQHLENTTDLSSPSFPASGAGSPSFGGEPRGTRSLSNGRRTRRLHLRNTGFRGPNVPGRRVTPANTSSTATTTTWSAGQTSDIENVSPTGRKKMYEEDDEEMDGDWNRTDRRGSGTGVLQDIVNSAPLRRARPRVSSAKFWTNADPSETATFAALDNNNNSSPPQPASSTTKSRSLRAKAKLNKRRRSASREAREYIEHLEGVLASTLEQLDTATSSTVAQEQSDKLRRMNAEMQRIHQELADLEATFDERVEDELEAARQREKELQAKISSLESQLKDAKRPMKDLYAANTGKWQMDRFELLEAQLQSTREALVSAEARINDLQRQNDRLHTLLADSTVSPSQTNPRGTTPAPGQRTRPTSLVPTAGSLAMSPGGFSSTFPGSPFSPRGPPGGPASPLATMFSPEVMSSDGDESDNSFRTSIIHPPDTCSRRQKYMRQFRGTETEPLLLPDRTLAGQTQRSATAESGDFTFPRNEQADGSPKLHHRRSLTRSIAERTSMSSRMPSGLTIDTNIKPDVNASLLKSPDFTSFEDNSRNFSTSTTDSTIGRSLGRNLYDELSAVRTFSTSTGNEQYPSEMAQDGTSDVGTLPTVIRSSPFDSDVAELPDTSGNGEHSIATTTTPGVNSTNNAVNCIAPSARSAGSSSSRQYGSILAQVVNHNRVASMSHLMASQASLGMRSPAAASISTQASHGTASQDSVGPPSQTSLSTLDSYRTVFSNLYRTPLDVVKHLAQTTAATMSIPRSIISSILSIPHWLFDIFLAPMLRRARAMLGIPSPHSKGEQQSLLQDAASPGQDANGLTYGTAYQTPDSSPSTVSASSNSMVAGTGKKRASSMSTKNAGALTVVSAGIAARDPDDQTRRWKHSPLLWLKFTVCLAFAVGEAFKRGPGNVLKEAHKSKKGKAGNWRKTNRGEPYTPSL